MATTNRPLALRACVSLVAFAWLLACSSSSSGGGTTTEHDSGTPVLDAAACYPDNDGISGGTPVFDLVVTDTGFYGSGPDAGTKDILACQNDARATVNLTNKGTKPHGFKVGCTNAAASYPNLPAGCSATVCFPSNAEIAPIAPGASASVTFDTPTPDGLIYPFTSNEPDDSDVPGLNDGQWTLM